MFRKIYFCLVLSCLFSCETRQPEKDTDSPEFTSLYTLKAEPQSGEWLAEHQEKYQSFEEYTASQPTTSDTFHRKIYVVMIGNLSPKQKEITVKTAHYLQVFYGLTTRFLKLRDTTDIYKNSRHNPAQGQLQLSASYLMEVLKKQIPADAATVIGLTAEDLYPGNNWNYVFGMASLRNRVGVWSINRFGNPENRAEYEDCLMSTLKTAVHETGHMFSLKHCVKYNCCMNGSNHLAELKSQPIYFCPDCLKKLCFNRGETIKDNLLRTHQFWKEEKNTELAAFYEKNIKVLN